MRASAIRTVEVGDRRRGAAAEGPIIAHIRPKPAGLGPAEARGEHRNCGVVAVDLLGGEYVRADRGHNRVEQPGRLANPVAQRGAVEF
jgi:hypothetical protein